VLAAILSMGCAIGMPGSGAPSLLYHRGVPALISCSSLRVDDGGAPAVDGLTFATTGERVLVLGAATALFEAAAGLRPAARGEIRIEGMAPVEAVRRRVAAGAPLDPRMPPKWSPRQYVTWSARIAGHGRAQARELAEEALARTRVESVASGRLGTAGVTARRATVLAAALASGATTLLLQDPLAALPAESVSAFARVVARACADRKVVVFAGRLPLESPLALEADEAIVVAGSAVAARGAPGEIAAAARSFWVRVVGDVEAFARAVEERGARVSPAAGPDRARVGNLSVELGPLGATDLVRIATDARVTVLELRPISAAFA
jgi:ABC-type multidrug transport system ATPase subunit